MAQQSTDQSTRALDRQLVVMTRFHARGRAPSKKGNNCLERAQANGTMNLMHHDGRYACGSQHEARYATEDNLADARVTVGPHD